MITKLRNLTPASWTILIFGILAFLLGVVGILAPTFVLRMVGFEIIPQTERVSADYTLVFIMSASMASLNMGVYYMLAALHNLRKFFGWTVPFRCLTFVVFSTIILLGYAPGKFFGVAAWELTGAIATGIALFYEKKSGTGLMADSVMSDKTR